MNERDASPPDKRAVAKARRFVEDVRRLSRKYADKLTPEDKDKLEAAVAVVESASSGSPEAPRLSLALKELDLRVEQILGFAKKSTAREYTESIFIAIVIAVVLRAFVVEAFKIPTGSMIPTLAVGDHIFVNKFIYGLRVPFTNSWFAEWSTPSHGDVIVFRFPLDLSKDYIKRVVAVAGDRVRVDGQEVLVNGARLDRAAPESYEYVDEGEDEDASSFGGVHHSYAFAEKSIGGNPHSYTVIYKRSELSSLDLPGEGGKELPGLTCTPERPEAHGECAVESGYVFVMGDNRDNSSDSRVWGAVPTSYVKGKAMFVWWSRGPKSGVRWDRIGGVVR
jgi:signal peptidase I